MNRDIRHTPRTKKDAFLLLSRVISHFKNSGKRDLVTGIVENYDAPAECAVTLGKLSLKVNRLWVKARPTGRVELQRVRRLKRRERRVEYKDRVLTFTKKTVPAVRDSAPNIFGQGFLRRSVPIFPYRAMDTFMPMHRVNVYRRGPRFDVVDALCNIPILAGLTRKSLKNVVQW